MITWESLSLNTIYTRRSVFAIVLTLHLIQKETFSKAKKEDKNEKLWLKLGELLNIPEDQMNTLDDDAKKQEIAKLRIIFRQPLANNDQQNRDD